MNLLSKIRKVIEEDRVSVIAQYCHPEKVPESALQRAEETAHDALWSVTDEEIEQAIDATDPEPDNEEAAIVSVLQTLANDRCDFGKYETIVCTIHLD